MSSEEWRFTNLGNIANFKTGKLNSNAAETGGIYPFFTCSPETYRINSFAFDCEAAILAGNNANGVFGLKYFKGKFNAYQRTYVITTDSKTATVIFLYYQLDLRLNRLKNISHGTATKYLTLPLLNEIEIYLPDIVTQNRIAKILSALDDKIELNRQTNATLEAIAQSIFKEWFVDFNFPGATGEMVDSEMGMIPMGWRVGMLGELFNLTMGQSPPGESYNENGSGIPFFQGRADFSSRFPNKRVFTTDPKRFAKQFDTLVSVRAPVGDMNIASEDCCIGRGLAAVIEKNGNSSFTYYFLLQLTQIFKGFEDNGTVYGSINKGEFERMPCILPPTEIIFMFEEICRPIDNEIFNTEQQSTTIAAIRDLVLPRLMSGQIDLGEKQNGKPQAYSS